VSWSFSVQDVPAGELRARAQEARDSYLEQYARWGNEVTEDLRGQIDAAIAAAGRLRAAVGGERVNLTLSGHANPGHRPAARWANDMVSLSISNADPLQP